VEFSARGIHHVARCEVSLRTHREIDEAPPAADKASRFRGSGTIGAPEGRGNRNVATVTVLRDEFNLFAAGRRQSLRRFWLVRALAAPRGAADRKGAAMPARDENGAK